MADQKITALTNSNTVDDTDLVVIVDDVAGTPATEKRTVAELKSHINTGMQAQPAEGAFVDGDKTKLDATIAPTGTPDGSKFLRDDGAWTSIGGGGDMLSANNLSDLADAGTARTNLGVDASGTDNAPTASTTVAGKVELATNTETTTGTDTTRAVTPAGLKAVADTKADALGPDDNYVTDAEKVVISNTSGTNTGDQTLPTALTDLDTTVTGTQLNTLYSNNSGTNTGDQDLSGLLSATDIASGTITPLTGALNLSAGADGDVLTKQADGSLALETPAGGGGGQSTYDAIVAPAGGDYTTLGSAIASASAGWRIFIEAGTYTETTITTSLPDLTIEGAGADLSILDIGTTECTFSGSNITVKNLGFTMTTGLVTDTGSYNNWTNVTIKGTGTPTSSGHWYARSDYGTYVGCYYISSHTASTTSPNAQIRAAKASFINCGWKCNLLGATNGAVRILSDNNVNFNSCVFERNNSGSGAVFVNVDINDIIFTGCHFLGSGSVDYAIRHVSGTRLIVNKCTFSNWIRAIFLSGNNDGGVIEGNTVLLSGASAFGIYLSGAKEYVITNNHINLSSTNTNGIYLEGDSDYNVINSNYVACTGSGSTGIKISASTCDGNMMTGNMLLQSTTPISDSGTNTTSTGNKTT